MDNLTPAAIVWNTAATAVDRSGIVPMFNNASDWMWDRFSGTALGQSGIGRRYREVGQIRLSGLPKWNTGGIVNGAIPDTTRIPDVGIQGNQFTWNYGAVRKAVNIGSGTLNITNGKVPEAAKLLGMGRATLYKKLVSLGIPTR